MALIKRSEFTEQYNYTSYELLQAGGRNGHALHPVCGFFCTAAVMRLLNIAISYFRR